MDKDGWPADENYQVDVVTESEFPAFLDLLEKEFGETRGRLCRNLEEIATKIRSDEAARLRASQFRATF